MSKWQDQYKHPKWQKKRLEVLNDREWTCEECRAETKTLHVHHQIYRQNHKIWDYDISEYHVLCDVCHDDRHVMTDMLREATIGLMTSNYSELIGYAVGLAWRDNGGLRETIEDSDMLDGFCDALNLDPNDIIPYLMANDKVIEFDDLLKLESEKRKWLKDS